jgi:hypothetical protein
MKNRTKNPTKGKQVGAEGKRVLHLVQVPAILSRTDVKPSGHKPAQSSLEPAPATRKRFDGDWDELKYLYQKILYWYFCRDDREEALKFRDRFEGLLSELASRHPDGIFIEECWSILYDLDRELHQAIEHREREIELILRLWRDSENTPAREHTLHRYGVDAFADRLELLAILYHDSGNLESAIVRLVESKRLCEAAGLPFGGNELLTDYLDEREPRFAVFLRTESSRRN